MRTKFIKLISMCLIAVALFTVFGPTLNVYASAVTATTYGNVGDAANAQWDVVKSYFTTSQAGNNTQTIDIGGTTYYYDPDKAQDIINSANSAASSQASQAANDQTVADFQDYTNSLGLSADVKTAGSIMSGFMGPLRTLLGIIVVLISVGMTVFSAFDLCYIAFPVFRNKCEDQKQNGGPMASRSKGANGENKLRFVSDDAQYAVVAADTVQSGKNPFIIYFGKRMISYLVLAILLFILLTGRITIFTDIAIKLVNGIIQIVSGV